MTEERQFQEDICAQPSAILPRLIYADWLDDCGDSRGRYLRLDLALRLLPPDHLHRGALENDWSELKSTIDPLWLQEHDSLVGATCFCYGTLGQIKKSDPRLHGEPQNTLCDGWLRFLDLIDKAADDGRDTFRPFFAMPPTDAASVITLPSSIAKLTSVATFDLTGAQLVRIPKEIGQMRSLRVLSTEGSPRLHWYPFEITKCKRLAEIQASSSRTLYGNAVSRAPFPGLQPWQEFAGEATEMIESLLPQLRARKPRRACSRCGRSFEDEQLHRVWITSKVGNANLPLLVNACSSRCIDNLSKPPQGYVPAPHRGGPSVVQPASRW
ncbi:MAG: TIGR02996 domain-containing protein [Pirellulales bacterium]|nr:TIGR02996 domain-containing protein [Pirellulales bacterium]